MRILTAIALGLAATLAAAQEPVRLEVGLARWQEPARVVVLSGSAAPDSEVVVSDALGGDRLGEVTTDAEGRFTLRLSDPDPVPCALLVEAGEDLVEVEVARAPSDCGRPGGGPPVLVDLVITGPPTVRELSTARYRAVAGFSDGSTQVVTTLARWDESSPWARIDEGLLRTQQVTGDEETELEAEFSVDGVTVAATYAVAILDVDRAPPEPRVPAGPDDDG